MDKVVGDLTKQQGNDFWGPTADLLQRAFATPRPARGEDGAGGE